MKEGGRGAVHGEASPLFSHPHTMDSVPATVPSVTASPGDPELLEPLSVFYAALLAKLLEVKAPPPGRDPSSGRRVESCEPSGRAHPAREKRVGPGPGQARRCSAA